MFGLGVLVAQGGAPATVSDDLAAAKTLYASAAYQEALALLPDADTGESADEVDQYRALCLIALGRTAEAQRSLEPLVTRQPLFKMSETDVSPRLVAMFHDVRRRLLPDTARNLYATAKTNFERKNFVAASTQLKQLLMLLADDDLAGNAAALSDLRLVGEGFLKLAEAELTATAKAEAPPPPKTSIDPGAATPAPAPAGPAGSDSTGRAYSDADADVTPPVDVIRNFPAWHPPNALAQRVIYRGVLKIVIDERGKVETATLVQPVSAAYDPILLKATEGWQFLPALRNGEAVKYQKVLSFSLSPR